MKNYYRILGIHIDAEYEEIRAAYRILAQQHHPDKGGSQREFTLIQEAYSILSDAKTKREYDKDLFRYLQGHQLATIDKRPAGVSWGWIILTGVFTLSSLGFAYWAYQQYNLRKQKETALIMPPAKQTTSQEYRKQPKTTSRHKPAPTRKKASSTSTGSSLNELGNYSGTFYLLNVGSFSNITTAKERQAQLKQSGFNSKIQKISANSEGDTSYNVFVGPFYNLDTANKIIDTLTQKNIEANIEQVSND